MKKFLSIVLAIVIVFSFAACKNNADLWSDATYTQDTVLGEGSKTVVVKVVVLENTVNFTINTDADTLGEALIAHKLVEGEDSEYGLYIKKVNGILADYDVDASYWAFTQNGEYMLSGVDSTEIAGGETYELTYTK